MVGTLEDVPADPQMLESGALVPIDDPRAGAALTVRSPIGTHGQDKRAAMAPGVGEHTVEVLREAGSTRRRSTRLLRAGAVAQRATAPTARVTGTLSL